MSGKFSGRNHKGFGSKFIWIFLLGIILIALGSLFFLQPKPPASHQVSQSVTLSVDDGAPVPSSPYATDATGTASSLPALPAVGSSQEH